MFIIRHYCLIILLIYYDKIVFFVKFNLLINLVFFYLRFTIQIGQA